MRKIYATLLSFFLFFTINEKLNAQAVSTYVFNPSSGTYSPLTGTTSSTGGDDGVQNVALGFNFVFGGVTYTNAIISTNGAVKLAANGSTGFATSWTNNLSNGYGAAIIAPAWDDNNASGGSVVYVTSGTAPNRTFSVEWINIHMGGIGSTATPTATFQVTLSETTNSIRFVYGTINPLTSSTIGIGLNDLTSFLSVTPGAPATTSSTTANNGISSAANLTSGTTYTFLPPPPCVAPPGGGTTQSSVALACSNIPFNLTVTGSSFGTGLTYSWETSSDGLDPWTSTGVTTASYTVANQTAPIYYRRKITCSGQDAFSTALLVGQNSLLNCYCPVVFDFDTEPITLVNFANINNASSATVNGSPDLEDFTSIVGNVSKGQTYPITVKGNTAGNFVTHINVFIDWNQDGDFTDPGENHYLGTIVSSTGLDAVQATGNILIPAAALDGNTKMRVIKKYNAQAAPCNTTGFGQAEDYTLSITTPLCTAPSAISVGTITPNSATVTFTSPGGTVYVEYGLQGFTPGTGTTAGTGGTVITPATSPQLIGGLAPNTLYDVYVRRDCGGGIFSENASGGSFRTLCNALTTFPYTETFETASTTRSCWTTAQVSGSANWTYGAGAGNGGNITSAHGGTVNARHFGNGTGSVARLISPALDFSAMPAQGAQITFWYANQNWLGDQNELRIYYKTSAAGAWTLVPGAVYNSNVGVWTEVEFNLPSSSGPSDYYIAFEGVELFGWGIAVDDVTISVAPTCPKPTNVSALGITPTSAAVSFTSPGNAFIVEYGTPGFVPGTTNVAGAGQIVFGTASPIIVPNLSASTVYDFYVRRICVPGVDFSTNVKATATTLCPATTIPYLQTFESATVPGMPTCTSSQDANGNSGSFWNGDGAGKWETYTDANPLTYVSPTKALLYYYDFNDLTHPADDWFYTQGLNLTGGTSYRLKFFYKALDGANYPEKIEVKYGTAAFAANMTTGTLFTNNNISSVYAQAFDSVEVDFTPPATDVYYLGFHAISDADKFGLLVDNIGVKITPLVDVGITGVTLPNLNCPTNGVIVQANIRNYNLSTINFATNPVTVTANITTGSTTTPLTATLNSGTLAPNATMDFYLSPAFNFAAGSYTITIATSSPDDPETGNDAFVTTVNVNPNPPAAVVTPAAPQICIGSQVQLNTQFIPAPPPVTLPAVSSGAITVNIPDGSAVGATHALVVNGVPAGATITGISVNVNLTHTWINDIVVNLRAPNGKILNLFNRRGAAFAANMTNTTISSASSAPFGAAPFTGTFAADAAMGVGPTGFVSDVNAFSGLYSVGNGNWTLGMRDYVGFDVGALTSWSITITYQVQNPVVTWSPVAGLFTNAAATPASAYTAGTDAYTVFAKPTTTTIYTVSTTTAAGCVSTPTNVTVTVNPIPVITIGSIPDTVCISDQVIPLAASPAGGSWSGIGVSGTNFIPPATAIGTYTLTYSYTSSAGCPATATKTIAVKDCPERIIRLSDNALTLFPNPNTGLFNIRINTVLYNYLTMKVYTNAGVLVRTQQLTGLTWGRVVPIDLTNLPGGSYMVQFYYDGGVRTNEKTFKVLIGLP